MFRAATSSFGAFEARHILTTARYAGHTSNPIRQTVARNFPRRPLTTSTPSQSSAAFRIRSRPNTSFTFSSNPRPFSNSLLQLIRTNTKRYFHNSKSWRDAAEKARIAAEGDPTTLSGRMKKLIREYGWSVLGVYIFLSAADFPFCYLLVRYLGTDRIGELEHMIVENVKKVIPESVARTWHDWRSSMKQAEKDAAGSEKITEGVEMAGWGVEEAEEANKKDASLATQLALAYAIHKSFMFIRVPLTAAITPKVVKTLRSWGWDIGKRTTKETKAAKRAAHISTKKTKKP
ncbi:peptide alpha-N-acetyltransferase protein [Rutstroemia sp. NJR-2017a BBW]|nr:peptide alpha-N-acetyltransferase protein [Rutstroemia sp. NJR-2017a BBW]